VIGFAMRHIPVEPPAFFPRGPSPVARLAFFGLVSIVLLFVDTRYHYLEDIRRVATVILYPLLRAAQLPGETLSEVGNYFASLRTLNEDNAALKMLLVERSASAQAYAVVQQENARLRTLLDLGTRYGAAATAVEVLYTSRDPFAQKLFIGKSLHADLQPGEAVIDADGVVGQVTRVFPHMAEVTLVTDKDHAVPVKVQRSGVRSVLYGSGAAHAPELRFMAPSADIQVGDVLVTSGLDGAYPSGLAVARVATLERETGQIFARITCTPLAGVDRSEHLLVLGRSAAAQPRPEEPAESDTAKKAGKGRRRGAGTP
jgi:rod shape-determining protein MreC